MSPPNRPERFGDTWRRVSLHGDAAPHRTQARRRHDIQEVAMLVFQWNALRVGDHVVVHDDRTSALDLRDGVVAIVQTYSHEANDVAIRLDTDAGVVLHPRRHAVHADNADARRDCWRCAATEASA
jgi:hypothetical protein